MRIDFSLREGLTSERQNFFKTSCYVMIAIIMTLTCQPLAKREIYRLCLYEVLKKFKISMAEKLILHIYNPRRARNENTSAPGCLLQNTYGS